MNFGTPLAASPPAGCRQLHRDAAVVFAGYRIPHPLEYQMVIKVQTNGRKTPIETVQGALHDLGAEVADIRSKFQAELTRFEGGGGPQY